MFENFIGQFKNILYMLAEISASTLEFIGILIIIIGSFRALVRLAKSVVKKTTFPHSRGPGKGVVACT